VNESDPVIAATRIVEQLVLEKHAVVEAAEERIANLSGAFFALVAEHDPEGRGRFRLTKAQVAAGSKIVSLSVEPNKGGLILTVERTPEAE
jgi:hypothetical protein